MKRREFITLLGGAAAWPLAARAQKAVPIIGFSGAATPSTTTPWIAAFVQRLREFGWVEGRNIVIEYRWAEGRTKRYAEIAAEFVRIKVDVIVTHSTAPVVAAKQATAVIDICQSRPASSRRVRVSQHFRPQTTLAVKRPCCLVPPRSRQLGSKSGSSTLSISTMLRPADTSPMKRARQKPTAAKLRTWRISIIRKRGQYLGTVEAPDEKAAEAGGMAEFELNEEQRRRLVVQERN